MARATSTLALLYSGGANNSNPQASIGGVASQNTAGHAASQSYDACTIPGIEITHAARNPIGQGNLSYTASNHSITWTTAGSVVSTSLISGSGWLAVGYTGTGWLRLYITYGSLPGSDTSQTISINKQDNTLFGAPASNEITNGVTEYCCLYLKNESANSALSVVLTQTDSTPASAIYIGSTFNPLSQYATPKADALNFTQFNPYSLTWPYTTSLTAILPREKLHLLAPNGVPTFHYFPTDVTQNSDGSTTDVEPVISDRFDSTNALSGVEWGATLSWASIAAGKMVSFWVKRVIPPNPTIPVNESVSLDITFTLS